MLKLFEPESSGALLKISVDKPRWIISVDILSLDLKLTILLHIVVTNHDLF